MVRRGTTEGELQEGDERVPVEKDGPGAARGVFRDVRSKEFTQAVPVLRVDVREVACLELLDRIDLSARVVPGRRETTEKVSVGDTDPDSSPFTDATHQRYRRGQRHRGTQYASLARSG
jgi:hypothetical protein